MKRIFSANVWQEGQWLVAQCLEVDVASQGTTEEEALANLQSRFNRYSKGTTETPDPLATALLRSVAEYDRPLEAGVVAQAAAVGPAACGTGRHLHRK